MQEKGAGDLIKFTPSKATGKVLARELPLHCTPFVSDQKEKGSSRVVYPSSELASNDVEEGEFRLAPAETETALFLL